MKLLDILPIAVAKKGVLETAEKRVHDIAENTYIEIHPFQSCIYSGTKSSESGYESSINGILQDYKKEVGEEIVKIVFELLGIEVYTGGKYHEVDYKYLHKFFKEPLTQKKKKKKKPFEVERMRRA